MKNWISTHTPLTGCNILDIRDEKTAKHFYSHTPHGVQHNSMQDGNIQRNISTHTPLTGCNGNKYSVSIVNMSFLLTHPSRGATNLSDNINDYKNISTHTPLTGCNVKKDTPRQVAVISTHTPLTGCNNTIVRNVQGTAVFLLTHPSRGATI